MLVNKEYGALKAGMRVYGADGDSVFRRVVDSEGG
jgi:hypothetical protein